MTEGQWVLILLGYVLGMLTAIAMLKPQRG